MAENRVKNDSYTELGPEITGTVIVGGRRTASGRIYSPKVLAKIASDRTIQERIRTHTFLGRVRPPAHTPADVDESVLRTPSFLVTHLGVEEKELRIATRMIPATFPDQRVMTFLSEAYKAGSVAFQPIGHGSVDKNGVVGFDYSLERVDLIVLEKHDVELPARYVPRALGVEEEVTPRPIMYGIGNEYASNEFGMTHGLVADLKSMLDTIPDEVLEPPESVRTCIIRFNSDGTDEVLYEWKDRAWIRCR